MREFIEDLVSSQKVVFFTGAGVSTPSGLRDFRGKGGLAESEGIDLEKTLNRHSLYCNPDKFWKYWNIHMDMPDDVKPNVVHEAISLLGKSREVTVVTQNIDGFHEQSGNTEVLALHGTKEIVCTKCHELTNNFPRHDENGCDGRTRPNAVLYEERLDPKVLTRAEQAIRESDMLVICGTTLKVFPAALLVNSHRKRKAYCINNEVPSADGIEIPINMILGDLEEFFTPLRDLLLQAYAESPSTGI